MWIDSEYTDHIGRKRFGKVWKEIKKKAKEPAADEARTACFAYLRQKFGSRIPGERALRSARKSFGRELADEYFAEASASREAEGGDEEGAG